MGEDVLKDSVQELVISEQAIDYPVITDYLAYKGLAKLNSTYGVKFLKHVSPITNRIHTSFIQVLNTGRVSSTSPNMQNIVTAKDGFKEGAWWREAFRVDDKYVLVGCDYSG
jgi:DNA polymerase-1